MAWWWLEVWWSLGGACGWPNSHYERLWVIHHDGVSKNQPVVSTWSLRGSRGSYTLARGAPTRTSGEWWLSDTSAKHRRIPSSLFTLSIYFEYLLCAIQFMSLYFYNCHARVGLELRLQVFCAVEKLETLSRHKGLIGLTIWFNYCKEF